MTSPKAEVWFNPACSTCRTVSAVLDEAGVEVDEVRYLQTRPPRVELERVLQLLGTDDPMTIVRRKEPLFDELGLEGADRDTLLEALATHPILIERPIVIRGDRAVLARPADRVREIL